MFDIASYMSAISISENSIISWPSINYATWDKIYSFSLALMFDTDSSVSAILIFCLLSFFVCAHVLGLDLQFCIFVSAFLQPRLLLLFPVYYFHIHSVTPVSFGAVFHCS